MLAGSTGYDVVQSMNRRQWLRFAMPFAAGHPFGGAIQAGQSPQSGSPLGVEQYQPKEHAPCTRDKGSTSALSGDRLAHSHHRRGNPWKGIRFAMTPETCLPVMDRKNIRTMVDLTGGYGDALRESIAKLQTAHPGRFIVFTEPAYTLASDPGYAKTQADLIEDAHKAGAKGLKVLKTLGLVLEDKATSAGGSSIDDPRFDPMWEAAGANNMPVAIHVSDPQAFFLPIDRFNERWEELHAHPDWGYYGKGVPSDRELQEARRNVMRRHPKTKFVCLHVADSEDLGYVGECRTAIRTCMST